MVHQFRLRGMADADQQKQMAAVKERLANRLTSPIMEIEKMGLDVNDVLNGWQAWFQELRKRNIQLDDASKSNNDNTVITDEVENE